MGTYILIKTDCQAPFSNTTVYPAVVTTRTEGQVCPSDDQRQNALNEIRSDIRCILGNSSCTTFTSG